MPIRKISKIIWTAENIEHISRHNVKPDEVEMALKDKHVRYLPTYNGRILAMGRSGYRLLSIILSEEKKTEYYLVTARDMSKKERKVYRDGKEKN